MRKIQYSVWRKETGNAGGKAKNDAFDIAIKKGYEESYKPSSIRTFRVIQQYFSLNKFHKSDIVFVQYPAVKPEFLFRLSKHLDTNTRKIVLIHDLRSLQGVDIKDKKYEINILNLFDVVISHNKMMTDFLVNNGFSGKVIELELFDYLHDYSIDVVNPNGDKTIVFAGNLSKSKFINDLKSVQSSQFILYGNGINAQTDLSQNIIYKGVLPSDKIVYELNGDFGLVWDGESIDTCSGIAGEYLRYNNPHKMSLYIAAGKPIIIWRQAAAAKFVIDNKIGIAVDSLQDINEAIHGSDYNELRSNTLLVKEKIARGYYLAKAIEQAERILL